MKKILSAFLVFVISASISAVELNWDIPTLANHLGYNNYTEVKDLTSDESWAVLAYGFTDETDYQDINGYLRHGDSYELYNQTKKSVRKLISDIRSAAKKLTKIPKSLVVYRGFKLNWRNNKCFKVGEIISDKAFISTSLNKDIANHFAFKKGSGKGAFLTIKLLSKQEGILITENDEDEVLLMTDRKITITESHELDGKCYAEATLD